MSAQRRVRPAEKRRPLVGRDEELALCMTVLESRDGSGIVVTGAAGMGKTSLAAEVLSAAEAAGYATLRVTATEAGRAVPLGPFAHLFAPDTDAAPTVRLLREARASIAAGAEGRPLVLLVDDAHHLDPASALLVQQLAAAREVAVLATVRTGEPLLDAIVALWKDHACEYLELQPLSAAETGVLVESLVGGTTDGHTKHRLWEASRGVPFVVHELVLGGRERGLLGEHAGLWRWRGPLQAPGRLLDVIAARLGHLDAHAREVLELVAVGEPLSWSLLDEEERAAGEQLIRRAVLVAHQEGRRLELRLAHPLFGEFARAHVPATRSSSLHRRLADALERTGLRRSRDLLRFATWTLDAGGTASPTLLLRAAGAADVALDSILAERLARAALAQDDSVLAGHALARALVGQERFDEADALLLPLAARAATDEERMSVAMARARNIVVGIGYGEEAEAVLLEAEAAISAPDLRRELELVRAWVLGRTGRANEAAEAAEALLDEPGLEQEFVLRAAGIAAHALTWAGRPADSIALVERWRPSADAEEARAPLLPAQYRTALPLALAFLGRLEEADDAAAALYEDYLGGPIEATAMMALGRGLVALLQGRLRSSVQWYREADELFREADPTGSAAFVPALAAQSLGQLGDAVGAADFITAAEAVRHHGPWLYDADILLGKAWAAAAVGALSEARQLADAAADLAETRGGMAVALRASNDLARLGDAASAAPRLERIARTFQGQLAAACAGHAQALVARDATRLEAAAQTFADLGARLWAAEADSAAAAAHRRAGRTTSARAAAARAAILLERCGGARTPALAAAGPVEELTEREREIAGLAAGGASNRQIATRLVVSVRTVENHLQHAYRKLGVRSRRDLPSALTPVE